MNKIIEEKLYKETVLKSKFCAYIFHCDNIFMQNEIIKTLKREHSCASHICFASVYKNEQHSNDDGEPSGTAGAMILTALNECEIVNSLCVVVRYFGGVKLGASRLGRVYKNCAKMCLIGNLKPAVKTTLCFGVCDYTTFDLIQNYLQKNNISFENVKFNDKVEFEVFVSNNEKENIEKVTPLNFKDIEKIR
ncbi:MAG: DUF1949 domain-containing protein [Clostridia bacterium]|nr:DUF1949 domain-containing protein [Clostridia bacterium]